MSENDEEAVARICPRIDDQPEAPLARAVSSECVRCRYAVWIDPTQVNPYPGQPEFNLCVQCAVHDEELGPQVLRRLMPLWRQGPN
jgi:hypothetical protein